MLAVNSTASSVRSYLEGRRQQMLGELEGLVRAESPSSSPEAHLAIRTRLTQAFRARGFRVRPLRAADGGTHLLAIPFRRKRHRPTQLLVGHFDTVWPVGTLDSMPFVVDANAARGPGAFDMKAGLVQMLYAFQAVKAIGRTPEVTPVVLANADEEIGSPGSRRFIELLARCCDRALVLEPAMGPDGALKTARKGIGRYTVTVHGRAAHAGLDPEAGASAILEMSHVIQSLFAFNDPERGISVNVGTVDGGLQPNVIAPRSVAVIDARAATHDDAKELHSRLHALRPSTSGVRIEVQGAFGRPPLESTPRNRALFRLAQRCAAELGLELEEQAAGGGSDGNTTSQYTATLDGLGAVGGGAHARHEFLYVDRMVERTALLALLVLAPPLGDETG